MARRLLDLVTLLSLLLCLAAAGLWVRSAFAEDSAYFTTSTMRRFGVVSAWGSVKVWQTTLLPASGLAYRPHGLRFASAPASGALQPDVPGGAATGWNVLGLGAWSHLPSSRRAHYRGVLMPYWLPVGLFVVLPALWLRAAFGRRAARARGGLCLRCGYDLRATPRRCPECGATLDSTRAAVPGQLGSRRRQDASTG